MARFGNFFLTNNGIDLLSKVVSGGDLAFTRFAIGDGTWDNDGIDDPTLTDLYNERISLDIASVVNNGNGMATMKAIVLYADLIAESFYGKEIGIFATDPDLGEILFSASYAGDSADLIPSSTDVPAYEHLFTVGIAIGNATSLTVNIDPSIITATKQELSEHTDDLTIHGKTLVSYAELLETEGEYANQKANLSYLVTANDGGGGEFRWNATSTDTPIYGLVAQVTGVVTGRWERIDYVARKPLNPRWCGAGIGDDDADTNAFSIIRLICQAAHRAMHIVAGAYTLNSEFATSTTEEQSFKIFGDGPTSSVVFVKGTNGVSLNSTGMILRDISIIDKNSYAVMPTSFPAALPVRGSITPGTKGLQVSRNNIEVTNVFITGFARGFETNNIKFYGSFRKIRCQYNLIGLWNATNFMHSYGCYYSSNFEKNVHIESGGHVMHDTSLELCADYNANNANYPNGGLYVNAGASLYLDNCWDEDQNNYSKGELVANKVKGIFPILTASPHFKIDASQSGFESKNLCLQPHAFPWINNAYITKDRSQIEEGRRYFIATADGGVGVSKDIRSPYNPECYGMLPKNVSNSDFKIWFGIWIKLQTANFTAGTYPFIQIEFEDTAGVTFTGDTPIRTQVFDPDFFDNTNITDWQFIGCLTPQRYTLATGLAIKGVRMRISMGETGDDYSADPRIMWFSEPCIKFINATGGSPITQGPENLDSEAQHLVISGGLVAPELSLLPVQHWIIDTQGGAATDDLDNIYAPNLRPGTIVIMSSENSARQVTCRDTAGGTGNLHLSGNFPLDNTQDKIMGIWTGTAFQQLSSSNNA